MKAKIIALLLVVVVAFSVVGAAAGEYDPCAHSLRWTIPGFNSEPVFWFGSDAATNLSISSSYTATGRYFLVGLSDVWVTGVDSNNLWGCYVSTITQDQIDTLVTEGGYPECVIVDSEGNFQSYDLTSGAKCPLPEIPTPTPTATPEPTLTEEPTETPTATPTVEPTPIPSRITLVGGVNRDSSDGGWVEAKAGDQLELIALFPIDLVGTAYSNVLDDLVHFEIISSDNANVPIVSEGKGTIVSPPYWENGTWFLTVQASSGLAEVVIKQIETFPIPGKTYTVSAYGDGEQTKSTWSAEVSNGKTQFFLFLPLILR